MRYFKDIYGAPGPIVELVPVYDATSLSDGALIMQGTTDPDSNADHGVAFVVATTGSSAEAVDSLGIIQGITGDYGQAVTVTTLPDTAAPPYLRAIVNPGAVYLAEYAQADTMAVASTSTTTITVTSLEDDIDIGWVFIVTTAVTGNAYNLRQLTASAAGSATMDAALSGGNETSGTAIKILPVNHRLTKLNTAATGLGTDAAAGSCVALHIKENWIAGDGTTLVPLRAANHRNTNWNANTKLFAEIVQLDHVFKNT